MSGGAVWMRVRGEVRAHRTAWLGLTLVVGLGTGTVAAAAAAARRTETAYPRMLDSLNGGHVLVASASASDPVYDRIEGLPAVTASMRAAACLGFAPSPDSPPADVLVGFAPSDPRTAFSVDAPRIVTGRLPNPARADEVLLDPLGARRLRAGAGERVHIFGVGPDAGDPAFPLDLLVSGIGITPSKVVPTTVIDRVPTIYLTPAYVRAHPGRSGCAGAILRLRPGTDVDRFEEDVQAIGRRVGAEEGLFFQNLAQRNEKVIRAIRPQATALWLFAALAGVAAMLVAGQGLARQASVAASEDGTLRALGMARRQLVARSLAHGGMVGGAGGILGVVVAVAASPLAPIGPARLAEPSPGVAVNAALLAIAFVATVLVAMASVAIPAWRAASAGAEVARGAGTRPSVLAQAVARAGLPPPMVAGVRMALEPGAGRARVPVRSALGGITVALIALVGATTFAASLDRLVSTPSLYGWDWDLAFDAEFGIYPEAVPRAIAADADVAGLAGGVSGESDLSIAGRGIPTIGLDPIEGDVFPTLIEGRPPRAPGEIVLGATTLRRAGRRVGDSVDVLLVKHDRTEPMTIVGVGVFPDFSKGSFEGPGLGEGAAVPVASLGFEDLPPGRYSFLLVRLRPGADRAAAAARLTRGVATLAPECELEGCEPLTDSKPADISNYARVRATPFALAGVLGLLAVATLAHALGTAIARKRRDLAILKTLGFVRRQVGATAGWQAVSLAGVALVAGIPLGIVGGRWAWASLASGLGVAAEPRVPALWVVVVALATLAVALAIAAFPARAAARTQPAVVLRAE